MKQLDDMTEPELRDLTTAVCNAIKSRLPKGTGFCVLFWPFTDDNRIGHYGSNAQRPDMIRALRETADRLERREDVTR